MARLGVGHTQSTAVLETGTIVWFTVPSGIAAATSPLLRNLVKLQLQAMAPKSAYAPPTKLEMSYLEQSHDKIVETLVQD